MEIRQSLWNGVQEAVRDVFSPSTAVTFVTTVAVAPILARQQRFQSLQRATQWVLGSGMQKLFYAGLGMSAYRAGYGLGQDDFHTVGHSMAMGGMLVGTKFVGERYLSTSMRQLGDRMVSASQTAGDRWSTWLHTHGTALSTTVDDPQMGSGMMLLTHCLDEIAAAVASVKSVERYVSGWYAP